MKTWSEEHIIPHSWETVSKAHWHTYPPRTTWDTLERGVEDNKLVSTRFFCVPWDLPGWARKIFGNSHSTDMEILQTSVVDPKKRRLEISSKNFNLADIITLEKKITLEPMKDDFQKTVVK